MRFRRPRHARWRRSGGPLPLGGAACYERRSSRGCIAQLVEQLTLNQRVVGSNPTAPTSYTINYLVLSSLQNFEARHWFEASLGLQRR